MATPAILAGMDHERPKIEINWVQSTAGALAAVSSAVLLSTFGVAGTLIGAALGSLVITLGGAVYSYSIRATRHQVAATQAVAAARIGLAQARVREASADVAAGDDPAAEEELVEAGEDLDHAQAVLEDAASEDEDEKLGWRTVLAGLPWKRVVVVTSAIFVVAMLAILTFELITGRAVSTYTGGTDGGRRTSIPGLGDGGTAGDDPIRAPEEERAPEESGEDQPVPPADDPTDPDLPGAVELSPPPTAPAPEPEPEPSPVEPAPADPAPADPSP